MNEVIKQFRDKTTGEILRIFQEEQPESPREWDNLGTIIGKHRRYSLCDKEAENTDQYGSWAEWAENELPKNCLSFPLYMMDHSVLTLSLTPFGGMYGYFDSGQLGYIYVTKKKIIEEYGTKISYEEAVEKATRCINAEIEIMNQYLHGEVYGYKLYNAKGEEADACWGYYGDDFEEIFNAVGMEKANVEELSDEEVFIKQHIVVCKIG